MPTKKHLTRKEAKAQRAGSTLIDQAASLINMDVTLPRLAFSSSTSSRRFENLSANEMAAVFVEADNLALSDEPGAKQMRDLILAGPGSEETQREVHGTIIAPFRLEDRANLATVQKALNVVIGLNKRKEKNLSCNVKVSLLESHQAAMERVIEWYEVLLERAEETELGLKLWATSKWISELAQEAWDGCQKWLEVKCKQGEEDSDSLQANEKSYDFLKSSRPTSAGKDDSSSTSSETSTHVPNNYFGAYQQELEKTATSWKPTSSDPETEEKIKKVETSLQTFYQIHDAAAKRNITFVEASPSPRWLLGALLQARMAIELLEKGQTDLTRYQQYALDLARRAEKDFEEVQRSEEQRGGPEVWGSAEPGMGLTTTRSKKKKKKEKHAASQQHGTGEDGRAHKKTSNASSLADATRTLDLSSSAAAAANYQPYAIPGEEGEDQSGPLSEGGQRTERADQADYKDQSGDRHDDGDSDSGASNASDATDSSAEINAWAAEAVRISLGGDTKAGMDRLMDAVFAGPGHDKEQLEARNKMFPSWSLPEDRARFSQVQEALNVVMGIPGVREDKTDIKVTVPAAVLQKHKKAMEVMITFYEKKREQRSGMGRDGDLLGSQKAIVELAQKAWCGCAKMLQRLGQQGGGFGGQVGGSG